MAQRRPWTRSELLISLGLYLQLPFGQLHQRQPEVIRYAGLMGRTPSALAMKLSNFVSLDESIARTGLQNASQADRAIWAEMQADRERVFSEITEATNGAGDARGEQGRRRSAVRSQNAARAASVPPRRAQRL